MLRPYRYYLLIAALLLAACSREDSHTTYGYIEGRYTYISASVAGTLEKLQVDRGSPVVLGQPLITLETQPESDLYRAASENLSQSIASRNAIAANLVYAAKTWHRYQKLVVQDAISQADLDNAHSVWQSTTEQLAAANATIASLRATLAQTDWTLHQKMLTSPINGYVFDTYYRIGEYVTENQAILSLLAPENIKAIFYVSETDLAELQPGHPVSVSCDHCVKHYSGTISFISPTAEYTPPVIYSNEARTKLVYRIEAEFAAKDAIQLHPGQPITISWRAHD